MVFLYHTSLRLPAYPLTNNFDQKAKLLVRGYAGSLKDV